jgi:hypothetical protein
VSLGSGSSTRYRFYILPVYIRSPYFPSLQLTEPPVHTHTTSFPSTHNLHTSTISFRSLTHQLCLLQRVIILKPVLRCEAEDHSLTHLTPHIPACMQRQGDTRQDMSCATGTDAKPSSSNWLASLASFFQHMVERLWSQAMAPPTACRGINSIHCCPADQPKLLAGMYTAPSPAPSGTQLLL